MKKEDCRQGMVVAYMMEEGFKGIVVKCNPKNARVRTVEKNRVTGESGSLWNIPYRLLEPVISEGLSTEMVMRSYEQPDNQGIKTYFSNLNKEEVNFPEGSPEWHIMHAVCELWRRLDEENLERECQAEIEKEGLKPGPKRRPSTIMREIHFRYSGIINKMFSALGREIPKDIAMSWESGTKDNQKV